MKTGFNFYGQKRYGATGFFVLSALLAVAQAQAPKRCDYLVNSTPGTGANTACLDLTALQAGGAAVQVADNATRISNSGLILCKNAFTVSTGGAADVVFIYDNSGSMLSKAAWVDPTAGDTIFYYGTCGNGNGNGNGTLTYQTVLGPRTIPELTNNNSCGNTYAGDPYMARGSVIKQAIDYMAQNSTLSTAGAIAFTNTTAHTQEPLQLNSAANIAQVENSIVLDTTGGTNYNPPLSLAKQWLNNPALAKNAKHAIVFISDGAPSDSYLNLVDASMPPVYSIFLGRISTPDTAKLKQLSDTTGGTFNRVDPSNVAAVNQVMQTILAQILVSAVPRSVTITNTTVGQTSVAGGMSFDANGNLNLALDSIIALNKGANTITVKVTQSDGNVENFSFNINATGPTAAQSTASLECYDPTTLVMLNPQGGRDSVYSATSNAYTIQLKRSGTDLSSVTISAASKDSALGSRWGDSEYVVLPQTGSAGGVTTFQKSEPFNGRDNTPTPKDGTLEADANGVVTLYWVHPRDPRDFASYLLPSSKIPSLAGIIQVNTLQPVTRGTDLGGVNPKDLVIYAGIDTVIHLANDSVVVKGGQCVTNCGLAPSLPPNRGMSFVLTTKAPYTYQMLVYDHLGQYVNKFAGEVDSAAWNAARTPGSDSVVSVMTVPPVAHDGGQLGTGVYILKTTIHTIAEDYNDGGNESHVTASTFSFIKRAGYLHP